MSVLPSQRQERFAQNIVAGMSQADAYVNAGYKPSDANAARLNGNDRVKARITELQARVAEKAIEKTGIDRARWVEELARIAFSDVRRVVTWKANVTGMHEDEDTGDMRMAVTNQVQIIDADQLDDETAAAISEISQTDKGGLKIKLHDKLKALDLIGKAEGFISDGAPVVNVGIQFVGGPPEETREQWMERKARERMARLNERPA